MPANGMCGSEGPIGNVLRACSFMRSPQLRVAMPPLHFAANEERHLVDLLLVARKFLAQGGKMGLS